MINLLKSDIYRLLHGKALWVAFGVLLAIVVVSVGFRWIPATTEYAQAQRQNNPDISTLYSSDPHDAPDQNPAQKDIPLHSKTIESHTFSYGTVFGPVLEILVALLVLSLVSSDLNDGSIKNVISARRRRRSYYGAKILLVGLLTTVMLALSIVLTEGAFGLAGFSYMHDDSVAEYWCWVGLLWLIAFTYGCGVVLLSWLTRSKTLTFLVIAVFFVLMLALTSNSLFYLPAMGDVSMWLPGRIQLGMNRGARALFDPADNAASTTLAARACTVFGLLSLVFIVLTLKIGRRKDVC